MIVSVHQSQFLPWVGYFDKIHKSDYFVVLDTVQFKKNEFQNWNKLKTPQARNSRKLPSLIDSRWESRK